MLATLAENPFDDDQWLYEMKWDGYRALAFIKKGKVSLFSRNKLSFNSKFPSLVSELETLPRDAILDGEIVVLNSAGKPDFQLLQNYQRTKEGTLCYYVFDLLFLEGYDLRSFPLLQRKELLKKFLPESPSVRYCPHLMKRGKETFQKAVEEGFEGIIAKDSESSYREGRSQKWLKFKTHPQQDVIICGFTAPQGSRKYFGALLLGIYEKENLIYVGHTGSGFDEKKLASIYEKLKSLMQQECPFTKKPKLPGTFTWVKPQLVCEVHFAEWTKEGKLRQAIFSKLREDKKPREVVKEQPLPSQEIVTKEDPEIKNLTHLEKVYWPHEGYTKGDLIEYYRQVAPLILPYLKDRPETLHRYPNGIEAPSFYQKEAGNVPDWIRTELVRHEERSIHYLIIENEASLLYTINLGCIELNPFNSRLQSLYYPDYLIIDLDPEETSFEKVIETAQMIHRVLDLWEVPHFCKTSGATGLHIYVPLGAQYTYEETVNFGKLIAHVVYSKLPEITSIERIPSKRRGKVYIDYLQNHFGQTVAAPYSVRPKEGAPVSTPLKWSEVRKGLHPLKFTMKTVLKRLEKEGDLFLPVLKKGIDLKKILEGLTGPH